ncbi:MAG: hypothetical protein LBJ62_08970 [Bifidobacteriaceae bacterium]|nr:hypothetical protein [Bifidobacteriaceae bacterium]
MSSSIAAKHPGLNLNGPNVIKAIAVMSRHQDGPEHARGILVKAKEVRFPPATAAGGPPRFEIEAMAETFFDSLITSIQKFSGTGRKIKDATRNTMPDGSEIKRFYDSIVSFDGTSKIVAFEHKIGWVGYSKAARREIERDKQLHQQLRNGAAREDFAEIEWVFFARKSTSGVVGPDDLSASGFTLGLLASRRI